MGWCLGERGAAGCARVSRRAALRYGLALGGLAAGAGLAGCGVKASAAAQPTSSPPKIILRASIPFQGNGQYPGTMQRLMDEYIAENWTSKHRGVEVKTQAGSGANGPNVGAQQIVLDTISGQPAPDTLCGCCNDLPTYLAGNVLLPLDSLLKQDNVDLSNFSPGHLLALQAGGHQMALPQYDGPETLVYDQGALDQLGLSYPEPGWTYEEATTLWSGIAAASAHQSRRVYGAGLDTGDPEWLVHAFGGEIGDAAGTHALLDSRPDIAAYTWLSGLVQGKVISSHGPSSVRSGGQVFAVAGGWDIESIAMTFTPLKWDFINMPVFPYGKPSTFINNDFNGINAFTKNPVSLVWDLFSFITMDKDMQYFQYKTTMITPNQINLWPAWIAIVEAEAPPLKSKNLKAYQEAVSYGWSTYFFRYSPLQANAIEGNWLGQVVSGKTGVTVGLTQATQQLNALEAEAASVAGSAQRMAQEFPVTGSAIAVEPAGV